MTATVAGKCYSLPPDNNHGAGQSACLSNATHDVLFKNTPKTPLKHRHLLEPIRSLISDLTYTSMSSLGLGHVTSPLDSQDISFSKMGDGIRPPQL